MATGKSSGSLVLPRKNNTAMLTSRSRERASEAQPRGGGEGFVSHLGHMERAVRKTRVAGRDSEDAREVILVLGNTPGPPPPCDGSLCLEGVSCLMEGAVSGLRTL